LTVELIDMSKLNFTKLLLRWRRQQQRRRRRRRRRRWRWW